MGRVIKKFNFINEPYIVYPSGHPPKKEINKLKEKEKVRSSKEKKILPDEDKIKSIYDDAFKRGMEDGFVKGRDTGLREGRIEGEKIGREQGFNLGYKDGFEKGKKEGFEKGYEEGLKKGEEEFSKITSSFKSAISQLTSQNKEFIDKIRKKILDFAFKFAEIIVKREIERDDNVVLNVLKDALQYIVLKKDIIIKVSISDIEKVEKYINHDISLLEHDININVIGDENLEKGSVIIISSSGEVDAQIKEMIQRTKDSLLG